MRYLAYALRKYTSPAHWAYGVFCAFLVFAFGLLAGLIFMLGLMIWEYWNDKNEGKHEGHWDWWESGITFCMSMFLLAVLQSAGVVAITWI